MRHPHTLKQANLVIRLTSLAIIGSVLSITPAHAASLAKSLAALSVQNASLIQASNDTQVSTFLGGTSIDSEILLPFISLADNDAIAFSDTTVQQTAEITADDRPNSHWIFSFDFSALLDMETAIDNPDLDQARTKGSVLLKLIDHNANHSPIDLFDLDFSGELATTGNQDAIQLKSLTGNSNTNFQLTSYFLNSGGNQESAQIGVTGKYFRIFKQAPSLSLISEVKNSTFAQSSSQPPIESVPEPSLVISMLGGAYALHHKHKQRQKQAASSAKN
jgi:hypothetical protein